VSTIATERLDLVRFTPELIDAVLGERRDEAERAGGFRMPDGWPSDRERGFLRYRLKQMTDDAEHAEWLVRAVVLREAGRPMVGHAGFHGKPGTNESRRPDAVEMGYTIFEPYRGRGLATEAILGLMSWARDERGVGGFVLSIAPDNVPSLRIAAKLGFAETGRHWDEVDGEELEFQRDA
jgi:RimJ/RimL family protein N-acetyltransferase